MNKFEKFLTEKHVDTKSQSLIDTAKNQSDKIDVSVSVKLYQSTIEDLAVLKVLKQEKSYAVIVKTIVDDYMNTLDDASKQIIQLLKQNK